MNDLVARTALVTGASRGIGRATARALARDGARVLVHYGNSAKDADSLVAEIREAGGSADAVGADLSAPDGAHKLAAEVGKLVAGPLDILVAAPPDGPTCPLINHSSRATFCIAEKKPWP